MPIDPCASRNRTFADVSHQYLWWEAVGASFTEDRAVAAVMDLGRYDDIRLLEALFDPAALAGVMRRAEPGWFGAPSWCFWRGRLGRAGASDLPDEPPRRRLPNAAAA